MCRVDDGAYDRILTNFRSPFACCCCCIQLHVVHFVIAGRPIECTDMIVELSVVITVVIVSSLTLLVALHFVDANDRLLHLMDLYRTQVRGVVCSRLNNNNNVMLGATLRLVRDDFTLKDHGAVLLIVH